MTAPQSIEDLRRALRHAETELVCADQGISDNGRRDREMNRCRAQITALKDRIAILDDAEGRN